MKRQDWKNSRIQRSGIDADANNYMNVMNWHTFFNPINTCCTSQFDEPCNISTSKIMSNYVHDEIRRMQNAFNSLMGELNNRSSPSQAQQNDEETPIVRQEMPGAFVFPSSIEANQNGTLNSSGSYPSIKTRISRIFIILLAAILFIILIPIYLSYRIFIYIFLLIGSIFIKIQKNGYNSVRNNDPTNVARRFIMKFDDRIGNKSKNIIENNATNSQSSNVIEESHLVEIERPDFMECAYSHALYIVKKDIRWLLVYIESDENKDSINFTHDVLINKSFLNFIKNRKILVWGGDIADSEAFQTANQFNITKLPFLGLLCLTVSQIPTSSGMQQSPPVLSLVSKIQGYKNLDATLSKFDHAYRKYNPTVNQLKQNNMNTNTNTFLNSMPGTLRSLQDEAYENSLRRNQQQRQENEEGLRLKWLLWRKSQLLPECNVRGEYARIAIRMPDGSRVQFKFEKTCSLEEIYAFVECDLVEKVQIDSSVEYELPQNYRHEYKFNISSLIPRQILPNDTEIQIADNDLVYPSGNLIVEML